MSGYIFEDTEVYHNACCKSSVVYTTLNLIQNIVGLVRAKFTQILNIFIFFKMFDTRLLSSHLHPLCI